ncbi:MAG: hypothetical protein H6R26_1650 [Proteobacteria bacterium]|nr:hypothetical protein [Pseudomonadota bacterium]
MRRSKISCATLAILWLTGTALRSEAALNAVDPGPYVAANGFFPTWYQDTNGLGLDLCLSGADIAAGAVPGGLGGPACTLLANPGIFDPAQPLKFPAAAGDCPQDPPNPAVCNFPDESFYFMADAVFTVGGVNVTYVSNLEAAFANGDPAPGDQIVFARIRIRITLPTTAPAGNYTVTHPYGVDVFSVATGGVKVINATRDVGVAPGIFSGALVGDIGPFLRDADLAPGTFITGSTGEQFIGDPNTPRPVAGSPFGTNFVRVDGPTGFTSVQSNLFSVMGKVHAGALATPLIIERSSYARDGSGAQQDIFVKAPPSTNHNVTAVDANASPVVMTDTDANGAWYGQSANDPVSITSPQVSVTAVQPGGPNTPTSETSHLVDVVTISKAEYSLTTHDLAVEATSSDEAPLPVLTVNGANLAPTGTGMLQSATLTGLTIPPATITVTSARGGSDTEEVVILP